MVTQLAHDGDAFAVGLLADVGRWLGEGIATLCAVLDPAVVAIGGGVAAAGDLLLEPARLAFDSHLSAGAHRPHAALRLAALGNQAGLIGAADLARTHPAREWQKK
jgi:glucokinase